MCNFFPTESLDELEGMVLEKFSEIENKNVAVPDWPRHPYAEDRYGQKVKIVPIKDIRSLTISFTTDDLTQFYKSGVSLRYHCDVEHDSSVARPLNLLFNYSPITI